VATVRRVSRESKVQPVETVGAGDSETTNQKGDTAMQKITPFLWYDDKAEEAADFYVSIFKNSKVLGVTRYGEAGPGPKGTVMIVEFQLEGQEFVALNAGPRFKFTEAISFVVNCETQEEVDYFWQKLSEGGAESQCGWLKDKYGLSWQVVPTILAELMQDKDPEKSQRVMKAMLQMKKIDIPTLKRAYEQQ
jgi:predicted 3-demethylubiquinone-9 3-methyltransferase (glyoxalase superfamily)